MFSLSTHEIFSFALATVNNPGCGDHEVIGFGHLGFGGERIGEGLRQLVHRLAVFFADHNHEVGESVRIEACGGRIGSFKQRRNTESGRTKGSNLMKGLFAVE